MIGRRLSALALTAALVLTNAVPPPTAASAVGAMVGAATLVFSSDADARSRSSSSSSSSRSSSSSYSRPSASSSASSSRTPSASSYVSSSSKSAADRAVSRENSARTLADYRRGQEPPAAAVKESKEKPRASVPASGGGNRGSGDSTSGSYDWPDWLGKRPASGSAAPRRPSADVYAPYRRYDPQWTPPAYAMQGARQFGMWDAAMLWFLAETLSRPGHAAFFHDNAADPGVQAWRGEAERAAQDNPALKTKLAALDQATKAHADTERTPGKVPDDVADMAPAAGDAAEEGGPFDWILGLLMLAAFGVFLLVAMVIAVKVWQGIFARLKGRTPPPAAGPQAQESATVFDLFSSGDKKPRAPFRVGMTVTVDPTPFLLAGDAIKTKQPAASASGLTNIQSVGTLNGSALTLHRLYLTDADFLQIHLDDDGKPDETRLFHVIDEVDPADQADWDRWLDKREGMIGWRDFQTPDGKVYERAWSPGPARIVPVKFSESEDSAKGPTLTRYECMLYRASTGLADPAPEIEYLLVSVVEREGQAWVEIAAGVDINPTSLSLT